MSEALRFVGFGIYSIPEAARLTRVSSQRIRRWIEGYDHGPRHSKRHSPEVWKSDLPNLDGELALSFRDLMEVRFVAAFRDAGVSWKTLRTAHSAACARFRSNHPFSTDKFRTDGKLIFLDLKEHTKEQGVIDICTKQHHFEHIVRGMFKDIEVADDQLLRWWPMGREHRVLLDPQRSFGAPIVTEGVATRVLALAAKANGVEETAAWYELPVESVRDAIAFERRDAA